MKRFSILPVLLALVCTALSLTGCGGHSKPISVVITASSSTVDGSDSVTLTAAVTNDKNSAGVSWAITSGGGTLSNQTTTSATYTAPAATSSQQNITITATSVAKTTQSGTVTITVPAMPAVTSTSANLTGAVGSSFSVTLQASGGIPPFTWALGSGTTLPSCLMLKSNGTLTTASGTAPTASCAGSYTNLTFKATDSGTPTPLSVTSSPLTITIVAAPAITFTGSVPATGTYGVAFSGSAAATGGAGALTYSISAGALPQDLSLNTSTGAITGTPSKAADVGTFNFTVQASDAYGDSNTQAYSIVISYPTVTVNPATPPTGYVGSVYTTTTLTATGGNGGPYNWTWVAAAGSSLPSGLSLSTGGAITGTPTTVGTYSVVVKATDSASNSGSATLTIIVKIGVSITTSTTLPTGYVGSNYSQQLAATGGSGTGYTWSVSSGSNLPGGLTLSATGMLSGAPTATGTPSFNLTVTDSVGNKASATFTMTISPGVSVTAPTLASAYPGTAYTSAAFTASGGSGTGYTWSWAAASGSTLPSGLSLGNTTGIISGTPVNTGSTSVTSNVVVAATDSVGNMGSVTVSIIIEASVTITTPTTLPAGTVSVAYSQTLAASGGSGTGYSWSTDAAGTTSLASVGLALAPSGAVTGLSPTLGTATFTATVTDSQGHAGSATFTVSINNQLKINQTTLPPGDQGSAYSQTLTASGGSGSGYTFSATNSNLASFGISLGSNGTISGTPTANGTVSFTANVKDSSNNTAMQALTITIYGALSLPTPNPSSLPGGYTNVSYTGSVTGSGGSGNLSMAVTTALSPANGTLATGVSGATVNVTGTPTTATTESFGVTLTDSTTSNTVAQTYTIVITTPVAVGLPAPNPSSLPSATVNQTYSGSINATGGVPPYTWSINGTAVTSGGISVGNGLSASSTGASSMSISGTPTSTGTVTLTNVKVVDAANTNATQTYTITVNSAGQSVTGQISLINFCATTTPNLSIFSVTITNVGGTTFTQTVDTDNSGNYTFTAVPNGTYTITPALTNSGPSVLFYPATQQNVTVSNANVSGENFNVSLGYTVSGTVSYSGAHTGWVYVSLVNTFCSGTGGNGTSIVYPFTSGGSFTIRGVPPGSYTLQAWMDLSTLNEGAPDEADPAGSTSGLTVSTANLTGQTVTLADPTLSAPTTYPNIKAAAPIDQGVVITYGRGSVTDGNGEEMFTSYTVQWSTSTSGFSSSNQATFKAAGTAVNVWILRNGNANMTGSFSNGTAYYFKIWGSNPAGAGPSWTSSTTVTPGPPASGTGLYQVTGTITIPSSVSINSGAPLYAGLYDQNTKTAYAAVITNPSNLTGNNFTVYVPADTSYTLFGILDQNHDGLIDAGDVTNTRYNNSTISISGTTSGENATLPSANSTAIVQTASASGASTGYSLYLDLLEANKLPVAVTLTSGPNFINPVDISYCQYCGSVQFPYGFSTGATPAVGDTFKFTVTYSDGTQDTGSSSVTGAVTGWNGTNSLPSASDAPTNLLPNSTTGPVAGTRTQPTFTWTDSSNSTGPNVYYIFQLFQASGTCPSGGCLIWMIPGSNSNLNGFPSSVQSITWGVDPTGGGSTPLVTSLTSGVAYYWYLTAVDSTGNQVSTSTLYIP